MPRHNFRPLQGRIETFTIDSPHLAKNLLGDPSERQISVYLPPGHKPDGKTPLLVDAVGFGGSGFSHIGWKAFSENVPQQHERLVAEGKMGPCVIAFPDCFTSLGGNQYVDSVAMGGWGSFLIEEMLPEIERRYGTKQGKNGRGIFGKSSGGFGAIIHGLRHGEHWGALACHSGDMGFGLIFETMLPGTLNLLEKHGGIKGFLDHFYKAKKTKDKEFEAIMVLAMAATYDPDPSEYKGIRLPCDPHTCELVVERWQNWLSFDPIHVIEEEAAQENLRSLKGLYIDCGNIDQYNIQYGSRQLAARLEELGIDHVYHEFKDNHSSIDYRMDESLPFLYRSLA
jgi:enterochelin esterase-like enzyme